MPFPDNEAETIELFKLGIPRLGWRLAHLQTPFPDAVIENAQGQQLIAEFEYKAKNFREHKHDPKGCNLIVCWHNDWPDSPLPIWALEDCLQGEAEIVRGAIRTRTISLMQANKRLCQDFSEQDGSKAEIERLKAEVKRQEAKAEEYLDELLNAEEKADEFEAAFDRVSSKAASEHFTRGLVVLLIVLYALFTFVAFLVRV